MKNRKALKESCEKTDGEYPYKDEVYEIENKQVTKKEFIKSLKPNSPKYMALKSITYTVIM